MLENLEKHAVYKLLSLTGLLIGIIFGIVKLKQELMPSAPAPAAATAPVAAPQTNSVTAPPAVAPATSATTGNAPPFAAPVSTASVPEAQRLQNQIYIDLDNVQLGMKYVGKPVDMPIIFNGFTPWLGGIASAATGALNQRYLFVEHYDINQASPPYGMLSSQTIVVPINQAQALRDLKVPARIMLTGQVKPIDVMKEMGMSKKFKPDALIFEVESFKTL